MVWVQSGSYPSLPPSLSRGKSDNVDLLRYRVQELEKVNKLYVEQKTQLVRLELECKELRERFSGERGGPVEGATQR